MSQEPSVLLVELSDKGAPFAQALSQVGRPSVLIALDEVDALLARGKPLGIVALARDVSQIAEYIRAKDYPSQLPLFVLQADAPGSVRPPLPEVTAVVPEEVEPGILALRIQHALQQVGGPRPRQATVLGMGSMSKPQALPSKAPSMPPSKLTGLPGPAQPPVLESAPVESPAAVLKSTPPAIPGPPPEVPWDDPKEPGIVSSAPPVAPRSQPSEPRPSAKPAVVSSAPPLPEIRSLTPSAPFIPEAAPLPADVHRTLGELSGASNSLTSNAESPAETVPTHPPVSMNPQGMAAESSVHFDDELGRKQRAWVPRALAAAAILAVLGVGAVVLTLGGSGDDGAKVASTAAAVPTHPGEKDLGSTPLGADPSEKTEIQVEPGKNVPGVGETSVASTQVTGEAALYKIDGVTTMDSCETALGKSAADFASAKKWRASQAWKLARKSLMAGQEEEALKHMCEASFIDASGPATIGLAKYYLGRRGLEQAHAWATKAVDAASGANSKRTAQQVLGDVLSQMGKVDEARSVWLESFNLTAAEPARLAPVVRNFINAAVKARKGGDPALAEQLLRRATTFEPENVNASALLSATLLENGEKKLAKTWAERALEKRPGLEMAEDVLKSLGG